jgi:hypothetical protein
LDEWLEKIRREIGTRSGRGLDRARLGRKRCRRTVRQLGEESHLCRSPLGLDADDKPRVP